MILEENTRNKRLASQSPSAHIFVSARTPHNSIGVGLVCSSYPSIIVLEALVLTAGITTGLTIYTFVATKQGKEFECAPAPPPTPAHLAHGATSARAI